MEFEIKTKILISNKNDLKQLRQYMEVNNMQLKDINISEVAKEANCSRDTIRRHLKGELKGYPKTKKSKVSKVKHIIEEILNNPNIKIKNKTGFYTYIKREYPELIDFKVGAFKYYLSIHYKEELKKKKNKTHTTRFETPPAKQVQFDYKENYSVVLKNGQIEKMDVGVLLWGNSRHVFRKIIRDKTTEATLEFLAEAFAYYGGVPSEMVIDNPKTLVTKHKNNKKEIILNSGFEEFIKDYGIKAYACAPYRPETKGKVERTMRQLEDLEYYNGSLNSIYDYNEKIELLSKEFNTKISQATFFTPNLLLKIEKEHMNPLPVDNICSKYLISKELSYKVSKTGTILYKKQNYSVPYHLVGKKVITIVSNDKIHFYYNKYFITKHEINGKLMNIKPEHVHPSVLRESIDYKGNVSKKKISAVTETVEKSPLEIKDEIAYQCNENLAKLGDVY